MHLVGAFAALDVLLTGIDPVPVAPDAVLLNEPFFDLDYLLAGC
jgi:hypothetical protein